MLGPSCSSPRLIHNSQQPPVGNAAEHSTLGTASHRAHGLPGNSPLRSPFARISPKISRSRSRSLLGITQRCPKDQQKPSLCAELLRRLQSLEVAPCCQQSRRQARACRFTAAPCLGPRWVLKPCSYGKQQSAAIPGWTQMSSCCVESFCRRWCPRGLKKCRTTDTNPRP